MADADHTAIFRTCTRCRQELLADLQNFPPHRMGKHGLAPRCRPCKKMDDAERRARSDQASRQKAWRDSNKDRVRAANAAYRAAGYSSTKDVARWRSENIEVARKVGAARMRERRAADPAFALLGRIRSRLGMLKKGKAGRRTEEILGYSIEELRRHLERQFTKGMSWDRVLSGEIHIDHIVPVKAFKIDSMDCPEFRACWALANLQPLWKAENLKKNAKRLTLL